MSRFFRQLLAEIRRREVLPVVVTYAVAGWLILQVAGLTFEPLGVPDWSMRVLIIITIAGFPCVFFLAWLINFRTQGMMFDLPLWRGDDDETIAVTQQGRWLAVMLCLLVLVATVGLVLFLLKQFPDNSHQVVESQQVVTPPNSIAVLAFDNFDGNSQTDYFAAGLAEEILNFLSSLNELNVAARTSSFRFKDEQLDIREVAKLLNVKHLLEGSVRRDGNRIRVTAQLVDGIHGYHSWSKTYDRDLNDVFAIQQEIAAAVVNELQIMLSVTSENRLQETPTANLDAFIFYLQGREKLRSSQDADVMHTAVQLFEQALAVDPKYSRAYAGLCEAHLRLYEISNHIDRFGQAQTTCDKAQQLSTEVNTEVKTALGRLYRFRGWYDKALLELDQAISAAPAAVDPYIEKGEVLLAQNKLDLAKMQLLRAVDLKRNYWKAHEALANYYYMTEQYDKSAEAYNVVTQLTPDSAVGFSGKGAAYWMAGDTQKALAAYERSLSLKPTRQTYTNLGTFYYYAGDFVKAANMQEKALKLAPDDHRIWGRLAESYRFVPGHALDSSNAYKRAAELAESNLLINSDDWLTRGHLGLYYVHSGRSKKGMGLIEQSLEQSQQNPEILYFYALALVQQGQNEQAVIALQKAVAIEPYYKKFIAMDPDLQSLEQTADFQQLQQSN